MGMVSLLNKTGLCSLGNSTTVFLMARPTLFLVMAPSIVDICSTTKPTTNPDSFTLLPCRIEELSETIFSMVMDKKLDAITVSKEYFKTIGVKKEFSNGTPKVLTIQRSSHITTAKVINILISPDNGSTINMILFTKGTLITNSNSQERVNSKIF